jgi:secondary thiamine-phosphate synthase enzyme
VLSLDVRSDRREQLVDITDTVRGEIERLGLRDGGLMVYVPHTTAAVAVNEGYDPDVAADVTGWMSRAVPQDPSFAHAEGNSDAHVKAILVGPSVLLPVREGRLGLGRWQAVFFCEFDGPRRREVWAQALAAA